MLLPLLALLGGCKFVVLDPAGDIASQQRDILLISTVLMLLIIIPVMALTALFAWKYRQSNKDAEYAPDWDHSTQLELVIWSAPLLIIICLGALTWLSTHLLDPYRPLGRISPDQQVAGKPLEVDVVALDWKWLFIYPEQKIAAVNELAVPVDRAVDFHITSSSVMNSFYIPALAGQIYAMPGMETRLAAVANHAGTYEGFSANYSGAGFSNMRFAFRAMETADFDGWVAGVRKEHDALDRNVYLALERPTEKEPVRHYAKVDDGLFNRILNMCVEPGKMCMSMMSAIDMRGGLGVAGIGDTMPLEYDKHVRRGGAFGPEKSYVASTCSTDGAEPNGAAISIPPLAAATPLLGAGLTQPSNN